MPSLCPVFGLPNEHRIAQIESLPTVCRPPLQSAIMWECRLIWLSGRPRWWDDAWRHGTAIVAHGHRAIEERPDLYLCVPDRPDVGLKVRGGGQGDVEVKVLHEQTSGWQLWEKTVFLRWNDLEAVRLATILKLRVPPDGARPDERPIGGARALLQSAGATLTELTVGKKRMQGSAGELLAMIPGQAAHPADLAELVEIQLPNRDEPLFSVCVETMDPRRSPAQSIPATGAVYCSYPELLVRHLQAAL